MLCPLVVLGASLFTYLFEYNRYLSIIGIGVILCIAVLFSRKRSAINVPLIGKALALQFLIALAMLKTNVGAAIVGSIASGIDKIYLFADAGSSFIFGNLTQANGPWGFIFAVKILPVIIFFGALSALLFYVGIVQRFIASLNYVIRPLLKTSGAETLCAIANSFLGQTESPLLIRSYLKDMTKSEMLVVMVSGMATISGSILVVFAAMGVPAQHLLASSVMSIPCSIMMAKILLPETEKTSSAEGAAVEHHAKPHNVFDAIASGTLDGLQLSLNIAAMLISFLALLAMLNYCLASLLTFFHGPALTLDTIFSYVFAPFGFFLGFTGCDIMDAGKLLGLKVAVNELVAYKTMLTMQLSERSMDIMTYALCGFSNFSCIGIQIGGIGALVPEKRHWLTELGLYAVLGGALSNILSAMMVNILL